MLPGLLGVSKATKVVLLPFVVCLEGEVARDTEELRGEWVDSRQERGERLESDFESW